MSPLSLLTALALGAFGLVIVLPLTRSYLRYGAFALVKPEAPVQRFVHEGFGYALLGYAAWIAGLWTLGPEALGVAPVPGAVAAVGLVLGAAGLALVMVAQAQMGRSWRIGIDQTPTDLVTGGVFRFSRNPIYLGMLGMAVGVVLVTPSAWTVMGLLVSYVLVGLQARAEEEHMLRQHGPAFRAWGARVGRFLPWTGRLEGG